MCRGGQSPLALSLFPPLPQHQVPSFATISPLFAPTEGGTLLTITGSNFKDRGFVSLVRGSTYLACQTPPLGEQGDVNGVYYARDGKTIQVS